MDPLLLLELLESNEGWEVRHLADNKGVFIGSDRDFLDLLDSMDWLESGDEL
jgi:hypothetical protein